MKKYYPTTDKWNQIYIHQSISMLDQIIDNSYVQNSPLWIDIFQRFTQAF